MLCNMKVKCKQNLYKSTYNCDIFIKDKEYEIIEIYRDIRKNKMCLVKSPIVSGDGGIDFFFDEGNSDPFYDFKKYFEIVDNN